MATNINGSNSLADAIANAEGFGNAGTIPTLANNPGDLKLGDLGYGTKNGITVFPSPLAGWQALLDQTNKMISGGSSVYSPDMTIEKAGNLYSGGDPNWAKNVASTLGVPESSTLGSLNQQSMSDKIGSKISDGISSAINSSIGNAIKSGASSLESTLFSSRLIMIVVGIILIAAGLYSFKQTQVIIQSAGRIGATVAKAAA